MVLMTTATVYYPYHISHKVQLTQELLVLFLTWSHTVLLKKKIICLTNYSKRRVVFT